MDRTTKPQGYITINGANKYDYKLYQYKSVDLDICLEIFINWYKKEVFVDRDPRLNAAGPITDNNNSDKTCSYYGQWSKKVL